MPLTRDVGEKPSTFPKRIFPGPIGDKTDVMRWGREGGREGQCLGSLYEAMACEVRAILD